MNQNTVKLANRKKALAAIKRSKNGISAAAIAKKCGLCLRTTQGHLRFLRDTAAVYNESGLWKAPNF